MYRFYVNDPVYFQKSIRVTIEHGHANNYENDYTSTAFWYQKDPHKKFPVLPSAEERLPGWPPGVTEIMEAEAKMAVELSALQREKKIRLSEVDSKLLKSLRANANKAFRELNYQEYMRDVAAAQGILERYRMQETSKKD
jgi:hypothetical protein